MSQAPRQIWGFHPIRKATRVFRTSGSTIMRLDPDRLRRVTTILVWTLRFVVAFSFAQLAYRPSDWLERYAVYAPQFLLGLFRARLLHSAVGGPVSSNGAAASLGTRVELGIGIWACI